MWKTVKLMIIILLLLSTERIGLAHQCKTDSIQNSRWFKEISETDIQYQGEEKQVPNLGKPGLPLSLDNVIAYALAENPNLKAAQARWIAAKIYPHKYPLILTHS